MFDYLAEICYNNRKAIESIGEKMSFLYNYRTVHQKRQNSSFLNTSETESIGEKMSFVEEYRAMVHNV